MLIFHLLFYFVWSLNKLFKAIETFWTVHSRPFIRYQGKNSDWFWIWCCFRFPLHCLVQPNQDIHFFLHVIFIIRIRLWIIQAVNLYFLIRQQWFNKTSSEKLSDFNWRLWVNQEKPWFFHQIKFILFKKVWLKKVLLSYSATSFFFTDIYHIVNFNQIFLYHNISRF